MNIPERREIKALFEHLLGRAGRDDVTVNVAYVVNFSLGENELSLNVLIDPVTAPWNRSTAKKVLTTALERLKEAEDEQDRLEASTKAFVNDGTIQGPIDAALARELSASKQALEYEQPVGATRVQIEKSLDQSSSDQPSLPLDPGSSGNVPEAI